LILEARVVAAAAAAADYFWGLSSWTQQLMPVCRGAGLKQEKPF
jgi:hypothetical protein